MRPHRDVLDTSAAAPMTIRGGILRVGGFAAGALLSVASAGVLFHALGVVDSGRYVLLISLVGITMGLTDAGLGDLLARELSVRPQEEHGHLLRSFLGLRVLLGSIGAGLACAYAILAGLGPIMVIGALLVGGASLLQGVQVVTQAKLSVALRFVALTIADLARQAATVGGIFVIAALGGGLLAFAANLMVASTVGVIIVLSYARLRGSWLPSFRWGLWREIGARAAPYAVAAAAVTVYLRLGMLFMDRLASAEETGYFGISARIVEVLIVIPQLMAQASLPILARTARDDIDRLRHTIPRLVVGSLLVAIPMTVAISVGAPFIIDVLAPAAAAPAADVLRWHSLTLLGSFAAVPLAYTLLALGKTRAVLTQALVALSVSVVATPLMIEVDGARGAALAAVIAELAFALSGLVLVVRAGITLKPRIGSMSRNG